MTTEVTGASGPDGAELPRLPFERPDLLDLSPLSRVLLRESPISRVRTIAGDEAWLVCGYAEAKALLSDPRLGRSHPEPDKAAKISGSALLGGAQDNYATERDDHRAMRRFLAPAFSARRMAALEPRIQELTDNLLDKLADSPRPANLHEALSFPLPVFVICELLGVPAEDRDRFRVWSDGLTSLIDAAESQRNAELLFQYVAGLIPAKRANPGADVLSDLIAEDLPEEGIVGLSAGLLFAGHETTVGRIDYGVLLLLTNPDQRAAVQRDPELITTAVEEVLRYALPGSAGGGLPRYAHEDIEIGGVRIKAGEAVLLGLGAANRDERAFPDPDRFDVSRSVNAHLGFGHGAHYCVGAALARIELRIALGSLLRRFPTLELAVPLDALTVRENRLTGGLTELPVTW